ncbi:hypothetical protein [Amycolatopsis sp. NBC_01480]|uniref:hypothetical protein n=1 Tax=Amycolatopsis sp. NBC_01480 TaxID=2903562 RepID=UPI002E2DF2E9|nr:hypothetical protein [Amycolatopsis sp. NBC_01480]
MTALIYIDPLAIHPVIDGTWHRARLTAIPEPGQGITMLCGATGAAAFEPLERRRDHGAPTTCFECEAVYMREHGMPVPTSHPGFKARPIRRRP